MNKSKMLIALAAAFPALGLCAEFSVEDICKAAVSMEMSRPSKTMQTVQGGETPQIKYTRPDGDSFLYKCKIAGNRIIWATYFTDTRSWGRWRDGEWDAVLTFRMESGKLHVSSSETGLTQSFSRGDF